MDIQINDVVRGASHPLSLTKDQKLQALASRFYANVVWTPEIGHYYTTSRADLEVYIIVNIDEEFIYTSYLPLGKSQVSKWKKEEFQTEGFGPKRVWVPNWVLEFY